MKLATLVEIQDGQSFATVRNNINNNFENLQQQLDDDIATLKEDGAIVFGTYTGNGSTTRTINLGFNPTAVLIFDTIGRTYSKNDYVFGGLALRGHPIEPTISGQQSALTVTSNGFTVASNIDAQTNSSDKVYYFIAFKIGTIIEK